MRPAPAAPASGPPAPTLHAIYEEVRCRAAPARVALHPRKYRVRNGASEHEVAHWHLFFWWPSIDSPEDDVFLSKAGDSAREALQAALDDPQWTAGL